jgi:hypothetical protein
LRSSHTFGCCRMHRHEFLSHWRCPV